MSNIPILLATFLLVTIFERVLINVEDANVENAYAGGTYIGVVCFPRNTSIISTGIKDASIKSTYTNGTYISSASIKGIHCGSTYI